jgi:flavin reductase (DIM6/NTAB) family NADH-FMN oxidoreductase RutF
MNVFHEVKPEEFCCSPFQMIGADWMLIAAQKGDGQVNAMTAGWGGMGVMWGKNVVFAVIRPQRYTHDFVEEAEGFSLTFFDSGHKKMLGYMGGVSGRQENKIEKAGLTPVFSDEIPYFAQANTAIICKKLYAQDLDPECFIARPLDAHWYPDSDYHTHYIGEIDKILVRK